MIKAIASKYCRENLVQLMNITDNCQLIVSADEIILLKIGNSVLINKYSNHSKRNQFPFNEREQNDEDHFTELFEYNKTYLNFKGSVGGIRLSKNYFFKGSNRALWLEESLLGNERTNTEFSTKLDRQEIEELFNCNNYDSMYIIDRNGRILFARNDKDNIKIGNKVIPSDDEIIEMEFNRRKESQKISDAINLADDIVCNNNKKEYKRKTIDEINDFKIYGPTYTGKFKDIVITTKNGKFDIRWFKVDLIEENKFRLTFRIIDIKEPTIDDVITFSSNYEIENTPEPSKPIPSFFQIHTPKNQKDAMNILNNTVDKTLQQEKKSKEKSTNSIYKRLQKVLRKK